MSPFRRYFVHVVNTKVCSQKSISFFFLSGTNRRSLPKDFFPFHSVSLKSLLLFHVFLSFYTCVWFVSVSFSGEASSSQGQTVILLYSRHCPGAIEWAKYLHKLFTELSKHKGKLRWVLRAIKELFSVLCAITVGGPSKLLCVIQGGLAIGISPSGKQLCYFGHAPISRT